MTTDNETRDGEIDFSKRDIAIVGIGCRFPQANDYNEFWENLTNGKDCISEIIGRWDSSKYYSDDFYKPNTTVSKWCGKIDRIDLFDNKFFNISPREAKNMDPQQRMLLEESWHCIEDSGVPLYKLRELNTSVLIGVMANDYHQEAAREDIIIDSYAGLGNYNCILANRISYFFGFNGVSMAVDAACASSLVAVHQARHSLINGESDYVLAGGVAINTHPWKYISFSKSRMLSPTGHCRTFDKDANGYVPGEGIAVILMQRLEDAFKAGNHIYGVIKGSSVNHGGTTLSITAPRVEAQKRLIQTAYKEAGFSPGSVSYMEAHGTGTSLGDPIEIEALSKAFTEYVPEELKFSSFESNVIHKLDDGSFTLPKFIPHYQFEQVLLIHEKLSNEERKLLAKCYKETNLQTISYRNILYEDMEGYYVLSESFSKEERNNLVQLFTKAGYSGDKKFIMSLYIKDERDKRYILTRRNKDIICRLRDIFFRIELLKNRSKFCKIGSVKTNIGHLEAAAGIAGLIKVLMMLKHQKVPPLVHLKTPNPIINWEKSPFELARDLSDWDLEEDRKAERRTDKSKLKAGVSSFGFGGVNSHVLVQGFAQDYTPNNGIKEFANFFLLSAKSKESFGMLVEKWLNYPEQEDFKSYSLVDICANLMKGRESFNHRWGFIIKNKNEIAEKLKGIEPTIIRENPHWALRLGKLSWSSYLQVKPLINQCTTFREIIFEVKSLLIGLEVDKKIIDGYKSSEWPETEHELYNFMTSYALTETLFRLGFKPNVICPEKDQLWLGLVASRIVPIKLALGYLIGKTDIKDILFIRPKIPYYDYFTRRTAMPFHFDEDYLKHLVKEIKEHNKLLGKILVDAMFDKELNTSSQTTLGDILLRNGIISLSQLHRALSIQKETGQMLGDIVLIENYCNKDELNESLKQQNILNYYLAVLDYREKALLLSDSQFTFKKYLEEWDSLLEERGQNITQMLKDSKDEKNIQEKVLLMVIIMSSLKKLNQKWNITDQKLEDELRFYELLDLIVDGVMPKELVIELFLAQDPNYTDIKHTLNIRQKFGNVEKSYTYIRDTNKNIKEVPDIGAWLKKAYQAEPILPDKLAYIPVEDLNFVELGEIKYPAAPQKSIKSLSTTPIEESLKDIMLNLWLKGVDIRWHKLYKEGTYHKLPLPLYPFNRKSFWIRKKEDYYFQPVWSPTLPLKERAERGGKALVFSNYNELSGSILAENYRETTFVYPADSFKQVENGYEIEVDNPDDYEKLLREDMETETVYFLWPLKHRDDIKSVAELSQLEASLIMPFFRLCRAISRIYGNRKCELVLVTRDLQKVTAKESRLFPYTAPLLGLLKGLAAENRNIIVRAIDIDNIDYSTVNLIARENSLPPLREIAYREQKRYIKIVESIQPGTLKGSPKISFKEKGVYLIAGGLGGISLEIGKMLALNYRARLVLAGRRQPGDKERLAIEQIEKNGGQVLVLQGDLTDYDSMQELFIKAKGHFGKINGVIHSASALGDAQLRNMGEKLFKKAFDVKYKGSFILNQVSLNYDIDFIAFFSSITSMQGSEGTANYISGCNFKDQYCDYIEKMQNRKAVTINWGYWAEVGIVASEQFKMLFRKKGEDEVGAFKKFVQEKGYGLIDTIEGVEGFRLAIEAGQPHLTIARILPERLSSMMEERKISLPIKTTPLKTPPKSIPENTSQLPDQEEFLVQLLAAKIGSTIEEIDRDESIFEMGVESIMAKELMNEIEKLYGTVSPTLLYECPTINKIKEYLNSKSPGPRDKELQEVSPPPREDKSRFKEMLLSMVGNKIGATPHEIDPDESLFEMGVESIMAKELMTEIENMFGTVSPTLLYEYPTINKIIDYLSIKNGTSRTIEEPQHSPALEVEVGRNDFKEKLLAMVSKKIGATPQEIDPDESLFEMGVESIMAKELMTEIESMFGTVSPTLLYEYPTINKIVGYLKAKNLSSKALKQPPKAPAQPEEIDGSNFKAKLLAMVSEKIGTTPQEIDPDESLFEMGVESIMAKELMTEIEKIFGTVSPTLLYEYPTISKIVSYLGKKAKPPEKKVNPKLTEPVQEEAVASKGNESKQFILKMLSEKIGTPVGEIDPDESFFEMGVESIMAKELMREIEMRYGTVSPTLLYEYPTVNKIIKYLAPKERSTEETVKEEKRKLSDQELTHLLEQYKENKLTLEELEIMTEGIYEL